MTSSPTEADTKPHKKKKLSAKNRKKVSKHILEATKAREDLARARATEKIPVLDDEGTTNVPVVSTASKVSRSNKKRNRGDSAATASSSTKKSRGNKHVKDVKEAAGYLSNWKGFREQWKFNKNTQSWLIRHMYEPDKVAKSTFAILLEYLQGLQGSGAKDRIVQEANRRALRYKKYEKEESNDNDKDESVDMNDADSKEVKFAEDTKEGAAESTKKSAQEIEAATEEEKRWQQLDDHEKRKEYKRARKVLETLN